MITVNEVCSAGLKQAFLKENPDIIKELANEIEINFCREYIRKQLKPVKKRGHSSYHFKHSVESYYNHYITNGAFIMAALLEGVKVERFNLHSPNVRVYLAYKERYRSW